MRRLLLIAVLGTLLAPQAGADIYRYVDERGNTVYTNKPPQASEAERVELPVTNLIQPLAAPPGAAAEESAQPDEDAQRYQTIRLTGVPEVTRAATLQVSVELQPALQENHRLRLLYDGHSLQPSAGATGFTVTGIERGVHRLQAVVYQDEGELQRSDVLEFRRHQVGLNSPAAWGNDGRPQAPERPGSPRTPEAPN